MRPLKITIIALILMGGIWCWRSAESRWPNESPAAGENKHTDGGAASKSRGSVAPSVVPAAGVRSMVGSNQTASSVAGPTVVAASVAGNGGKLTESALRQIAALQADKAQRTPVQQKIDSQLLYADKMRRGVPVAEGIATLRVDLDKDDAGRVELDITARVTDELLKSITDAGGKIVNSFARYEAVRAWLPLAQVESVAGREEVKFVRPAVKGVGNSGSVDSEGDFRHRANVARANFTNATGIGVKVGVLSDSVDFLGNSQTLGDLGVITVITNRIGVLQDGHDQSIREGEGTAMLEIVHDLAPIAQLFFATAQGGPGAMAQNILDLRFKYGCDIIVDDWEYFSESPFQDAIVAQAVNAVTADGALYFSSASNSGNKNDNTSSTWEGDFLDGGATSLEGGRIHSFGTVNYNTIASGGSQRQADLFWADPLGAATNDYDVFVLDSTGLTVVASSTSSQTGSQDPYEHVGKVEVGQRVVVVRFAGASRFLHLEVGRGRLTTSTAGRTKGHASAVDAFCVAAVDVAKASFTNSFVTGAKNPVETFSSDGPRRVFFSVDGTPISPGNFSSSGGVVRQKPDIAAADGVTTTLPLNGGLNPFFGTSAAAPHAAAIAALIKSYNPSLTPAQIRAALTSTALDIEATGWDRDSGYGIVMADAALRSVPGPALPTITTFTPSSGTVGAAVTITGTKLNGATGVKFNGTSAVFTINSATQITATVPAGASTGFITVTTPTGTATNASSFTVLTTPVITSLAPSSGATGSSVVINGANFTGVTSVKFNGTSATTYTVNSTTKITATVPASATTGRIMVTTTSGTATSSSSFTVTPSPVVIGFAPISGGVGTTVVVTGANFATVTNASFNGVSANGTIDSATQLTLTVPAGATTGPITVTSPAGTGTSVINFMVIPTPSISSFTPNIGPVGTSLAITGTNFLNATSVSFNGVSASFTVTSASQVTANVPAGATTGTISVRTPGGVAMSASSFTVITAPANDNFTAAQVISGNSGTVSANSVAATKETGEPAHAGNSGGKSVWYRWAAPSSGVWKFDTVGSGFDTTLAVYTGTTLTNVTQIASNDDAPGSTSSSVTFLAGNGTVYWIAVDGFNGGNGGGSSAAGGSVVLNWALTASTPVIRSFSPVSGVVGTAVTINGANFTSPIVVKFNGTTASGTFTPTAINVTVPVSATTGPITVDTPGGTAASLANFVVLIPPTNDQFATAQLISGNNGSVSGANTDATKESGEPNHAGSAGGRSVWYRWIAPASGVWVFNTRGSAVDTLMAVYTGNAVNALTLVASNDDSGAETASCVAFNAVSGQEYRIAVDSVGASSGSLVLNWSFLGNAPVICDFTPADGGIFSTVTIKGFNFVNVTAVQFNGVNSPSFVTDSSQQVRALVPSGATNGPITLLSSSGTAVSASSFTVTDTPFNDDFASAGPLPGNLNIFTLNSSKATKEAVEPNHGGVVGGRSLWFYWVAPSNGVWTFDTAGSSFDTTLAVYTGTAVTNLTVVAGSDDTQGFTFSSVSFTAVSNTVYRIAVDGYNGAGGDFILRYQPVLSPLPVFNANFETGQGYSTSFSLAGQQGWVQTGTGGNGILTSFFPDSLQQAFIGFSSGNNLQFERPFNYTPDLSTRPIVRFSVKLKIYDSTNFRYDHFRWRFYNQSSQRLFTIDFNNADFSIAYVLDGAAATNSFSSVTFDNDTIYTLSVTMDFANNRWTAFLDDKAIAIDQPITTAGAALNLRSIAPAWVQADTANPGDNYMVFDDYIATAETSLSPSIAALSSSKTVTAGTRTSLAVLARGATPANYQWRLNGVNISGATNAILAFPNVAASDAGNYSVVVSNTSGTVTSGAAVLTVNVPPTFSVHPQSQTAIAGTSITFMSIAAGTAPLAYQWFFNVTNALAGATNVSLTVSNAQPTNAGGYNVAVTNVAGAVTSSVATLTVLVPPAISASPTNLVVNATSNAVFSVNVGGTAPLAYQWFFNGSNALAGQASATLTLSAVTTNHAGNYSVVITNVAGSVTSSVAALTVNRLVPTITWSTPAAVTYGTTLGAAQLNASTGVAGSYGYSPAAGTLLGAGTRALNVTFTPSDSSVYVPASGSLNVVVNQASLTVTAQNQSRLYGQSNPALTVSYSGFVSGETNTVLATQPVATTSADSASAPGNYAITVSGASAANYAITHVNGTLTVTAIAPAVTQQPTNVTVIAGQTASFTTMASGGPAPMLQWYFQGTNVLVGATNASVTVTNAQSANEGGYRVVASNVGGSATSVVATLTVLVPPSITVQPESRTNSALTTATFSASAIGTAPLAYQWEKDGISIGGATSSTLTLNAVTTNAEGGYRVVITNVAGSVTSSVAVLAVNRLLPVLGWSPPNPTSYGAMLGAGQLNATSSVPGAVVYTPAAGAVLPTGSNLLAVAFTPTDGTVYLGGGLTVTQVVNAAVLTVTANNISREYGFANPALTVRYTGFVNGETNTVLTAQPVAATTATGASLPGTYPITVSGATATNYAVTHVSGTLTVTAVAPVITASPTNVTVVAGSSATFSVVAAGTPALAYQWLLNTANVLAGATNTSLTVSNAQPENAGGYMLVVTNVAGSVTSVVATLTVLVPPAITVQPTSAVVNAGQGASFNVSASGTQPLNYQWFKGGAAISGETNALLFFSLVTNRANGGVYSVTITNLAGANSSSNALLRVRVPHRLSVPQVIGNGVFRLTSSDQDGGQLSTSDLTNFNVQVSTSLTPPNWQDLVGIALSNGVIVVEDTTAPTHPRRFYRVIER